jgi:multimeric flavodoxin WrbA
MKALILNGSGHGDEAAEQVKSTLKAMLGRAGWTVEAIDTTDKKIATCTGCFGCWVKTPGECVIKDEGRDITRKVVESDLFILVSPITFGGYSSGLKKAMDRLIPAIMPYFVMVHGEIHHKKRYDRYPGMLAVGLLQDRDDVEADIFMRLVERNAINFHSPVHGAMAIERSRVGDCGAGLAALLSKAGVSA